jgi:hypothetical protein
MIEAQIRYVMSCLRLMRRQGQAVMEVREQTLDRFGTELRERLKKTVWQAGGWTRLPAKIRCCGQGRSWSTAAERGGSRSPITN